MNKEQFLAMSLPHGLKGYVDGKGTISGQNIYILFNCPYIAATVEVMSTIAGESDFYTDKSKFKPILHPLSDLAKPIAHKGETFVPLQKLWYIFYEQIEYYSFEFYEYHDRYLCHSKATGYDLSIHFDYKINEFWKIKKLIEWHFDISGLIEKGEAIDVNTLQENPYK